MADEPSGPPPGRLYRTVAILSIVLITGWATTYNMVAALWRPIGAATGLSRDAVFLGPTLMLIVAALLAPRIGRALDAHHGREIMIGGAAGLGVGLGVMALAEGPALYYFAWIILGVGGALSLGNASHAIVAQLAGSGARRVMTIVTIAGALSSTIGWPAAATLNDIIGWRTTLAVFAAVQVLMCMPLAAALPRARRDDTAMSGGSGVIARPGAIHEKDFERGILLFTVATALQGLVSWGLYLNLIAVLEALGHAPTTALAIAVLIGPASIAARGIEIFGSQRHSALTGCLVAFFGMVASVALLPLIGSTLWGALLVSVAYGAATGFISLARATVPLELFGRQGYGTRMGRMALPQNLAFAASPVVFAVIMERAGLGAVLAAATVATACATAAIFALWRLTRTARAP